MYAIAHLTVATLLCSEKSLVSYTSSGLVTFYLILDISYTKHLPFNLYLLANEYVHILIFHLTYTF